jgi:hypothetical protein
LNFDHFYYAVFCRSYQFVVNYQYSKIEASNKFFNDDAPAVFFGETKPETASSQLVTLIEAPFP